MCGIAGYSGHYGADLLTRMGESIRHRGPDDEGQWLDSEAGVGLAHRRLSIIDLSPEAAQPMWDATHTVAIAYNGELYNFRELKEGLIADGFAFNNRSDTEVLLNLYLRDGEAMLEMLNGIYAFALWDARKKRLFIARDGFGVKPLYYAETRKGVLFASELKALLQADDLDRSLNPAAVHYHMTYLWSPAPHTMLKGVKKLEPGCAMIVADGKIDRHWRFYQLPYDQPIEPLSDDDAAEAVREALKTAVERQMVADVPVGAFLSGGLDSSAIVAFARQYQGADVPLDCFTIAFTDEAEWVAREGAVADRPYAEKVAKNLGVNLHQVQVGAAEMADHLETMIHHLDEPQADPAPINALLICRLAKEHGIKVLLSGAGGDDLFTGYRRHYALMQEPYWSWLPGSARKGLAALAGNLPARPSSLRRLGKAFQYADLDGDRRLASYFNWLHPDRLPGLLNPAFLREAGPLDVAAPLLESLAALPPETPPLNRMLFLEGKHFLADHNLNYTDKMSMATGVEVRVPFLDPDLAALAARLPLGLKQRGREGKWILKKAMEPHLPHDVIYRPKSGFGAPLRAWLNGPLKGMADELLSSAALNRRGVFDPEGVRRLREADAAGRVDAAYTLFSLLCMELFFNGLASF